MKKQKTTKRALLMSALSMLLCLSMLVGSTFAWFTDSVTSGRNTIVSGQLDVNLYYATLKEDNTWTDYAAVTESTKVFNENALYEPGYTEVVKFKVVNEGTLALKYTLDAKIYSETAGTNVYNESFNLSNYLYTGIVDAAASRAEAVAAATNQLSGGFNMDADKVLYPEASGEDYYDEIVLVLTMPTTVGNEANFKTAEAGAAADKYQPKIDLGIVLVATQATYEADDFDNLYDKDATYPVQNAEELTEALAAGGSVVLMNDIVVTQSLSVGKNAKSVINLNGNDLSYAVDNSGASAIINNAGTLSIVGEGEISYIAANPDMNAIPTYATNTITNTGNLTIGEGVVVKNASEGGASYAVDNRAVFTLDGGTLIGERCALRIAKFNDPNVVFTMNSGSVIGATPAWIHLPGSNAADAPNITVTINGGIFRTTKTPSADNDVLYTYSFGNSHANTAITINGGEFLGGTVSIGSGYYGDVPALTINGGTFEYDVLQWLENDDCNVIRAAS